MRGIQILKYSLCCVALLSLISCEKLLMDESAEADPQNCFESLWETIDRKYSYLEQKSINWDSIYVHYDPEVDQNTTDAKLFRVLDSMLYDLRDGHVNLLAPFNFSRNWSWYLDYPENFSYEVIERNYLGDDYQVAGGLRYRMIDSIGYIYYGSFSSGFSESNLDEVFRQLASSKGLVLDVRNNGGGSLSLVFRLATRFTRKKRQVLLTREKTGPGHTDFGNELTYSLEPSSRPHCEVPVVLLTNRRCYSATNTFAGVMSQLDDITLMGDFTGGGGGVPVDYELPNGWRYRFSASQSFIYTNSGMLEIEGGVPPDIRLDLDPANLAKDQDDILEAALQYLR